MNKLLALILIRMKSNRTIGIWVYAFWPMIFLAVCWGVWLYGIQVENSVKIGVRPRTMKGLLGVLTHPFFHSTHLPDGSINVNHILNNSHSYITPRISFYFTIIKIYRIEYSFGYF